MANFEEKLISLEAVVERLERGELSLDESVKLFEEGMQLSAACRGELEAAEGKIQQLVDQDDQREDASIVRPTDSSGGRKMAVAGLEVDTFLVDEDDDEQ